MTISKANDSLKTDTLSTRYQFQKILSQKAGRKTILATDVQTQVQVVIKIVNFGNDFEWDTLKLFEREANTLKTLDHPRIPKYLGTFDVNEIDNSGFALVQSYVDAPSLESLVCSGYKFSEADVIELADHLLRLLIYLHQQSPPVIHRDIKPSNILLKNRSGNSIGDIYLVDFGSVQTVSKKENSTITIVGSYGYMPLEQFGGRTTTVSDLYSLGMTLIYLLTGSHPAELSKVDGQVQFNAEISKSFERWLKKVTHPRIEQRFENAKAAQLALNTEDSNHGDSNNLKPPHTQISLRRDRNQLILTYFDMASIRNEKVEPFVWILFGLFVIFGFFSLSVGFLLFFGWIFSLAISRSNVSRLNSITIDEHNIYKQQKLENQSDFVTVFKHQRSQIGLLAYNPGYQFSKQLDNNNRLVNGGKVTSPPKLYLYCGNTEYYFPPQLSEAELWWVGNELSDFLNRELQVIYPTPKVPPVPSCGGGC